MKKRLVLFILTSILVCNFLTVETIYGQTVTSEFVIDATEDLENTEDPDFTEFKNSVLKDKNYISKIFDADTDSSKYYKYKLWSYLVTLSNLRFNNRVRTQSVQSGFVAESLAQLITYKGKSRSEVDQFLIDLANHEKFKRFLSYEASFALYTHRERTEAISTQVIHLLVVASSMFGLVKNWDPTIDLFITRLTRPHTERTSKVQGIDVLLSEHATEIRSQRPLNGSKLSLLYAKFRFSRSLTFCTVLFE